ncbi:MAG: hypothetical protein KJO08_01355 [Gammaproteobacteria bacterium]|nr:hypothetical protein [Gammaproteobacteria bacterium]
MDTRIGKSRRNSGHGVVSEFPPQQRQAPLRTGLAEIGKAFQEGIDSGPGHTADEVFDALEEKYSSLIHG